MPKVHTQKAAKGYPADGIKRGDTYYSWEFRYGGVHRSKTYPRPSQLTQSKMSGAYAAREAMEDDVNAATEPSDIENALNECAGAIRDVASEYEDSLSNMPDSLQQSSTGEDIQAKIDALEEYAQALEDAAGEVGSLDLSDYEASPENDGRDIVEFSQLSETGQDDMMEAAREIANNVEFNEP